MIKEIDGIPFNESEKLAQIGAKRDAAKARVVKLPPQVAFEGVDFSEAERCIREFYQLEADYAVQFMREMLEAARDPAALLHFLAFKEAMDKQDASQTRR